MNLRRLAEIVMSNALVALLGFSPHAHAQSIASAELQIQGSGLRVVETVVTTAIDVPTSIQTEFGGKQNDEAIYVEDLLVEGDLSGPGLLEPITLTTLPGQRLRIPGLPSQGVYTLSNVRLLRDGMFLQPAFPPAATITVADVFQTTVRVRQLTAEELRARGINLDSRHYDVYEYTFSFYVDGQLIEVPYPVYIDPITREPHPVERGRPYHLPEDEVGIPPRWMPPTLIPTEFVAEGDRPLPLPTPGDSAPASRPRIPAAIVIPNDFAVLHQFFDVGLFVTNGAPEGSGITLDSIEASLITPPELRVNSTIPSVSFGRPVPIVGENEVTLLVADAEGEAKWILEGLRPGTHTIQFDLRATYRAPGQPDLRMKASPKASIVVHDPRFNISFSHPDTVRAGNPYSTYSFITNLSPATQSIRVGSSVPSCISNPAASVCRDASTPEFHELTLEPGEMRPIEYRLVSNLTGQIFATAGTVEDDALTAAVQLHMGVSESGVPLSPATLVLPYYAQFLGDALLSDHLQLLGLGYSIATAPLSKTTAKLPRVIRTDVFARAVDLARAGQHVFIGASEHDALLGLALDLTGNTGQLEEWDELRRLERSGRTASRALAARISASAPSGATPATIVDSFAAQAHRQPFLAAAVSGVARGVDRPYALSVRGTSSNRKLDVPSEAPDGWVRQLPWGELNALELGGQAGELAIVGRWSEDLEVVVTPAISGWFQLDLAWPGGTPGTALRGTMTFIGTAGEAIAVALVSENPEARALSSSGAIVTTVTASEVAAAPLSVVAARQDLHLDETGRLVSILFNRPIAPEPGLATRFEGSIVFDGDGIHWEDSRPISIATPQPGDRIVNLGFDHILSTNASYTIAIDPLGDPLTGGAAAISGPSVPRIDNNAPAGILYGRVLRGDNSPVAGAEVALATYSDRSTPFPAATQVVDARADGSFLFESVRRDPAAGYDGAYSLKAVDGDGKETAQSGVVRLPGRVQFVSLVYLGRGSAEGTVRFEDGTKVAGAKVVVGSTMINQLRQSVTGADGVYRVTELPVGPLTISGVDPSGNTVYAAVELKAPGQIVTKDLTIQRRKNPGLGDIRGVVLRSDSSQAVAGARVGVLSDGYAVGETYTGSDGRFAFGDVPSGFVTVLAAEWSVSRIAAAVAFDLAPDATRELTLTLEVVPDAGISRLEGSVLREDPLNPGNPALFQRAAGALVRIEGIGTVTADAAGDFVFETLPESFSGRPIQVWDPATSRAGSGSIPTLPSASPMTILIPATGGTGTVRVKLVDAAGFPVEGYRVLIPGFQAKPLDAKGGGIYELNDVPVGATQTIWAVPNWVNANASHGQQWTFGSARVEFAGHVANLALRLPGEGRVRVGLRSDIDLIGDVEMTYRRWDELKQGLVGETTTISTSQNGVPGFANFEGVPALESFTVKSSHPVHGQSTASGMLAFEGDLQTYVLQLNRLATVRGVVYEIDGRTPIVGATVRLSDGRQDQGGQLSGTNGSFEFRNVPPGTAVSVVSSITRDGIYRTGFVSATTPSDGGAVENLGVVMRRRGTLEGRLVYAAYKVFDPLAPWKNLPDDTPEDLSDNAPVPLAKFWLRELGFPARAFGSSLEPMTADAQGRFELSNIFEGNLRGSGWDPANLELRGDWTGTLVEEGERVLALIGIGGEGVGGLEAEVVDPNAANAPVVNAEVLLLRYVSSSWRPFDSATTDGAGRAKFVNIPVGDYSLQAYSKALAKSGLSGTVVVLSDQIADARVLLQFRSIVRGEIVDPMRDSEGVVSAHVTLRAESLETRTTSGDRGLFEFEGVPEGSFALSAREPGTSRYAYATGVLTPTNREPFVPLELEPTASLHVVVDLPADDGFSSGVAAPGIGLDITQEGIFRSLQNENPAIVSDLLRNRGYSVTARELGGKQRSVSFSGNFPVGDSTSPLRLVLPAFGSLRVTVAQGGVPASGARVRASGGGTSSEANTDGAGVAVLNELRLGPVSVQATSLDGAFSDSGSLTLASQSVTADIALTLGAYAGISGFVEAESGGPSVGTRVVATFSSRNLEILTDSDGRFRFQGIPTSAGGTTVALTYIGPDEVTVGARQTLTVPAGAASTLVEALPVRLDATPPRILSLTPADGATEVSPDSSIVVVFSELIRSDQLHNGLLKLIPADSSQSLSTIFLSAVNPDGSFAVTMTPPSPPPGQPFRLASNTLYRILISADLQDATGNRLATSRGASFITSDYAEPRVVRTEPASTLPLQASASIRFVFNEPIDTAGFTSGAATITASKLSGSGGTVTEVKNGNVLFDPVAPTAVLFAPAEPFAGESLYRFVIRGARDLQGNIAPDQTFEFFTFDVTPPHVALVSPVPAGTTLVSGVEYEIVPEIRNGTATGPVATDVARVDWSRVEGSIETFVYGSAGPPWSYRFVAPDAPAGGMTLTIRAVAHDLSLNASVPADLVLEVRPNQPPVNLGLAIEPASFYPGNRIEAVVSFDDEGLVATAEVELAGLRTGGAEYRAIQTKQMKRDSVAAPWTPARLAFDLPGDLAGGSALAATLHVTDVRGLSAWTSIEASVLADAVAPEILSVFPANESRFDHGESYLAEAMVRDLESGIAEIVFEVDGQTVRRSVPARAGTEPGSHLFSSGSIVVSPKNLDTRVPVVFRAIDRQGNETRRTIEIIYVGVNDPSVPYAAWANPVDRAAYPAASTLTLPLKVIAADDIAVIAVEFEIEGVASPVMASRLPNSDVWQGSASITMPGVGETLTITAIVRDADPLHEIRLPIRIEGVAIDIAIEDRTQAILESDRATYEGKSVLVRGGSGLLVPHVAIAFRDLILLDGARVETLPSTTSAERRLELAIERFLHVDQSSSIDVTARGYLGGWSLHFDGSGIRNEDARGRTDGNVLAGGTEAEASASHAGLGGLRDGAATNAPYGDFRAPSALGGGGGGAASCCTAGGAGGGAISLARSKGAANSLFAISGTIAADGESGVGRGGAGAGGSIRLDTDSIVTGALARIRANGGDDDGYENGSAGAGGGRVAMAASLRFDLVQGVAQARGGRNFGSDSSTLLDGGAGTVFLRGPDAVEGTLVVSSFDERNAATAHQSRPTPLAGGSISLDELTAGPLALLRIDAPIVVGGLADNRSSMTIDPSAVVLLASDVPAISVVTAPAAGSSLIQATTLTPQYEASSLAGVGRIALEWSPLAEARIDATPAYPQNVAPPAVALPIPHDAAPGAATLRLVAEDRAGRTAATETVAYTIVVNAPPSIDRFDASPGSLYPGSTATLVAAASDDVKVATFTLRALIGETEVKSQSFNINAASTGDLTFTYTIPPATAVGQRLRLEANAADGFPGRVATIQGADVAILADTNPPSVSILAPAEGSTHLEGTGSTIAVRVAAADAEVDVQAVTASIDGGDAIHLAPNGSEWIGTIPVPPVEGIDPVAKTITIVASDYASNSATASVGVLIEPFYDENAPVVRWTCPTEGGMFPAGYTASLRVHALGNAVGNASNGVATVELFVGGAATALRASPVSGLADHFEGPYAIPVDFMEGRVVPVRAVVSNVAGLRTEISTSLTIVSGSVVSVNLTIDDSNGSAYEGKSLIFTSGKTTIVGTRSFERIVVLAGATVTHPATDASTIHRLDLTASEIYVGCGGSIDATGLGFNGAQNGFGRAWPNTFESGSFASAGGSHGGLGGAPDSNHAPAASYGSVFEPDTPGSAGGHGTSSCSACNHGGGVVRLVATGPTIVDGAVLADGRWTGAGASGAGGSILVRAESVGGAGTVRAAGADLTHSNGGGGGGRIALHYDAADLEALRISATGGKSAGGMSANGAPGTIYLKDNAAPLGDLLISNFDLSTAQRTTLPAVGYAVALGVTATSVRAPGPFGSPNHLSGLQLFRYPDRPVTWPIISNDATTIHLDVSALPIFGVPGDTFRGLYRFESIELVNAKLASADAIEAGGVTSDATSSIHPVNEAPPVLDLAKARLTESAFGQVVSGDAGATFDTDLPVAVIGRNESTGVEFTATAHADGSFSVGVSGKPGETITLRARDGHLFPWETAAIPLGALTTTNGTAENLAITQAMAGGDGDFRARRLSSEGRHLVTWKGDPLPGEGWSNRLVVFDVTDPAAPLYREAVNVNQSILRDVEVSGDWAVAVSESGFATIDLSATPVTVRHGGTNGCTGDYSVAVDGSYAFVGNRCGDGRIEVWDITDPTAPRYLREQGTSPIWAIYHDLVLVGPDYLAGISPDSSGTVDLVMVDRRDISNLKSVTRVDIPGFAPRRGRVDGERLYLTDQDGQLATVDVSNPRAPVVRSLIRTGGSARAAEPHGDILAVADGSSGLAIYDTSPASPVLLGINSSASPAWDVELRGTGAIIATGAGLATLTGLPFPPRIDVNRIEIHSAGATARIIGLSQSIEGEAPLTVSVKNVRSTTELTEAVAADGSIDVLLAGEAGDSIVITATDGSGRTAGPVSVGYVPFGTSTLGLRITPAMAGNDGEFRARRLSGEGRHLVTWKGDPLPDEAWSNRVVVFDVTDPAAPLYREAVNVNQSALRDVEVSGNWAVAVSENGFATLDLSATPVTVRHGSSNRCAGDYSVAIDGSYAFVGNRCGDGRIEVWDITDPTAPRYLREQGTSSISATYHDLVLMGSYYLAGISPDSTGTADLVIVDRSDVNNLKYVTRIDIPEFAPRRGRIEGDLLFLTDLEGRWAVVDLTNPETPRVLSVTQTGGLARNMAIAGTEVVVANGTSTVGFWSAADPTLPVLRGEEEVGWSTWDARHHAGALHVAADLALGTIAGVPSPPSLAKALITVTVDAGTVTLSGSTGAALGSSPLTLAASVPSGGTAAGTPYNDGGFLLSLAATPGESITLTATDAEGRSRTIALKAPGPG